MSIPDELLKKRSRQAFKLSHVMILLYRNKTLISITKHYNENSSKVEVVESIVHRARIMMSTEVTFFQVRHTGLSIHLSAI
jgi:hypothetical protein